MTNVALVVLDTLRKDAFDEHFGWLPGKRYENAISTSHWTAPVHSSLFVGKYPSELGVTVRSPSLSCTESTLAEQLSEEGYTTRAFSCNPYISKVFDFNRGFDQFDGSWRLKTFDPDLFDWNSFIDETREMGLRRFPLALYRCLASDTETLGSLEFGLKLKLREAGLVDSVDDDGAAAALSYVRETDFHNQEFLFMNLMEAHAPYKPPDEYKSVEPPDIDNALATVGSEQIDAERARQAYDDAVAYLSDVYRDVFKELQAEFDIVITLSDHGELFGEHGAWEHLYGIYPELTRVPLVISEQGTDATIEETVSLLDVYETVLDAVGIEADRRGRSLLSPVEDVPSLAEYHGLQPRKRKSLETAGISEDEIAAYETPKDGVGFAAGVYAYESPDGLQTEGDPDIRDPEAVLSAVRDSIERREEQDGESALPENVEQQLRDLGYV